MDFFVDDINFNTRDNLNVTTFKNVDIKSKRIDLNSTKTYIHQNLIDDPVVFETNIVNVKPEEDVPPEYPDNPEQIEQSDNDYRRLCSSITSYLKLQMITHTEIHMMLQ